MVWVVQHNIMNGLNNNTTAAVAKITIVIIIILADENFTKWFTDHLYDNELDMFVGFCEIDLFEKFCINNMLHIPNIYIFIYTDVFRFKFI